MVEQLNSVEEKEPKQDIMSKNKNKTELQLYLQI